MSSPAAGVSMLTKSREKRIFDEEDSLEIDEDSGITAEEESVLDPDYSTDDSLPLSVLGKAEP